MLSFIVEKTMEQMSDEECRRIARGTVGERLIYTPDYNLITQYEKCGGEWTEIMRDKYRAQLHIQKQAPIGKNIWDGSPIGRGNRLKIYQVWVRVPPILPVQQKLK